ncbi:hypothetical protein BUE93_08850 [Chromobacterium amazonense]|uniref:Phage coat protein n=1 Tax=Chromobacterium amazonense TaxID=1382803 RepID=A0A2S9X5P4_9NEIS|nr:hypothetical protein BUE93_08850 [Chromobacterium amazonense]
MSQCVMVQPDQSLKITTTDAQSCAGYLLLTPQEVSALQSPFVPLSATDGAAISGAIFLVWGAAWLWGEIGSFLKSGSGDST